ncbi:MAG: ferredoxin, partial [Actinobacteria bacterium]|nr:ATP-binding protein [Actinomycetota bacterium]NIV85989.1 ferredoxin [Actinomycetota bacterium]NIW26648.1 ferredoxin [Actinomycetota bacterium]NIX19205.1 ferredoxin [Actinomycetota bacterium]
QYDTDHPGRLLQRVLLGYLRRTIQGLPCDGDSIVEIAVAANPTMRDLLFGLDVATIGQLPYRS